MTHLVRVEGKQDSVKTFSHHCFSKGRMECIYCFNVAAMEQQVLVSKPVYYYVPYYSFDPLVTK